MASPIILEEVGPGVCVADFDGDGWQDIYFVNGRDLYKRGIATHNALYRNNGDGTFTDVTEKGRRARQCLRPRLRLGRLRQRRLPRSVRHAVRKNILYHNNGDGTFTDVTDKAGVGRISTPAHFTPAPSFSITTTTANSISTSAATSNFGPKAQRNCRHRPSVASQLPPRRLRRQTRRCSITTMATARSPTSPRPQRSSSPRARIFPSAPPTTITTAGPISSSPTTACEAYLYHNNHNGTFSEAGSNQRHGLHHGSGHGRNVHLARRLR